jgi:hypothetical protein
MKIQNSDGRLGDVDKRTSANPQDREILGRRLLLRAGYYNVKIQNESFHRTSWFASASQPGLRTPSQGSRCLPVITTRKGEG